MGGETPGGSNGQTCIKNDHDASTATDAGAGLKTSPPAPLSRAAVFAFSPFSSLSFSFSLMAPLIRAPALKRADASSSSGSSSGGTSWHPRFLSYQHDWRTE